MSRLVIINGFLILIVVTLGALTRLLDAGLGCPDWPVCYGSIIPLNNETASEFTAWSFDDGKAWMEMIHRYCATLLGFGILFQTIIIWKAASKLIRSLSVFLLVWIFIQGLFGMWTVTLRLWPPVVSAHLLGGAITIGVQFLIWRLQKSNVNINVNPLWSVFVLIVFVQLALGAWTSSQYAGLACPDFPTCQGRWWITIDQSVLKAPIVQGDEYLGGIASMKQRMEIQWLHRLGAVLVLISFITILFNRTVSKKAIAIIALCLSIQIILGILNAVLLLPLTLALLHNTFAILLWISALNGFALSENKNGKDKSFSELVA